MKNLVLILISIILLSTLQSCKKYSEDASVTLRTPKKRLVGNWTTESLQGNVLMINNEPDSAHIKTTISFTKDGNYTFSSYYKFYDYGVLSSWAINTPDGEEYMDKRDMIFSASGTWDFDKKKENININYTIDSLYLDHYEQTFFIVACYEKKQVVMSAKYKILELTRNKLKFEVTFNITKNGETKPYVYCYEMLKV